MRRVYLMYCGRQVCKPVPRIMIGLVLALALVGSVSVVNVLSNAFNVAGFGGLLTFALAAFTHAAPVVQVVTAALAGMIVWAAYDTSRHFKLVTQN